MNVAIIGSGLQCRRRAPVLIQEPDTRLTVIDSLHPEHARQAAEVFGCEAAADWTRTVARDDVDVVLVCTPPHLHAEIANAALRAGKHVLCEKPLTRTVEEAESMIETARETGRILKCGFNHRHHPAVAEAKRLFDEGAIGRLLFMRCRYGMCGRPGYENEWRADPQRAAGGQFIEQGTHAIDLFRWFGGELTEVACMTSRLFFTEQTMDEGGMAVFRVAGGATAELHTTMTQWKNQFVFEVFGSDGYLIVEGLGASYGQERLIHGRRDFTAPFNDHVTEYRGGDRSWKDEWKVFADAIVEGREPMGNGIDGLRAMIAAKTAYRAEAEGRVLPIA